VDKDPLRDLRNRNLRNIAFITVLVILGLILVQSWLGGGKAKNEVNYSLFRTMVENDQIAAVSIKDNRATAVTLNGETLTGSNGVFVREITLVPGGNTLYITATDSHGNKAETSVDITYSPPVQTTVEKTGYSKTTAYAAGAGALILGLIIGMILAMLLWKKKPEKAPVEEEEAEEEIPEEEEGISEEEFGGEEASEEELFGEEEFEEPEAGAEEEIPELEETEPGAPPEEEDIDFDVGEETEDETEIPEVEESSEDAETPSEEIEEDSELDIDKLLED